MTNKGRNGYNDTTMRPIFDLISLLTNRSIDRQLDNWARQFDNSNCRSNSNHFTPQKNLNCLAPNVVLNQLCICHILFLKHLLSEQSHQIFPTFKSLISRVQNYDSAPQEARLHKSIQA